MTRSDTGLAVREPDPEVLFLRGSRHPLAHIVGRALDDAGVSARERIVLGVSGGSDSMAMMMLVGAIRARQAGALQRTAVVSIDHGLRDEGRGEAEMVVSRAQALGFGWAQAQTVQVARDGNRLDAARQARLAACRAACAEFGSSMLLLAHQAEDRAESLLIGLARGMGVDALAALLPMRAFEDGLQVARPLLDCRRGQLREFLSELGVDWVEDPSNQLRDRGALRSDGHAAALLGRIVDGCGPLFADGARLLDLRDQLAAAALPSGTVAIGRESFESLHPAVRGEVLARMARHAGTELRRSVVERISAIVASGDRAPHTFACAAGRSIVVDRLRIGIAVAQTGHC